MFKQSLCIINFKELYIILDEIKGILNFNIFFYKNKSDFSNQNNLPPNSYLLLTKFGYKDPFDNLSFKKKNILVLKEFPLRINTLIEMINISLIKQRYYYQSKIQLKNYSLDLNSRLIKNDKKQLKLTEREIDIILFLNNLNKPQTISTLQSEVWGHSSKLETHTVETHVYRLRKKISDVFDDNNFILSHDEGYLIK